jgi:hypothetical protein
LRKGIVTDPGMGLPHIDLMKDRLRGFEILVFYSFVNPRAKKKAKAKL